MDSHRTVLMIASPYAKRGYVSHRNSSFAGLLKTVFGLLRLPPLNLFDATAAGLADCFTADADFAPYSVQAVDKTLFDPAKARDPILMASAMKKAVEAGREAFLAGRMPKKLYSASPSSPTSGLISPQAS